jgi:predicted RNA-binding protein with PUA-like domain
MKAQPTMAGIIEILKNATADLSAKGVVHYADWENTSENIRWVQDEMFDLVEAGKAVATKVEGKNGGRWFFRLTAA